MVASPFYISAAWSANPSTPKRPLIDLPEVQTLSPGSLLLSPACVSFTTPATTCSNITGRHSTHSRPGQNTIQDTQPIDECSSSSAEQSDSSSTFTTDPYKNCFV
ncbi:unnamed protein product [Protopolystoma xenopodis]|uniref:Uncharacterized protein n=1 Tax=Protopolystoma xenopodis TaxID=117903 RepID=A0A3S5AND8_9PLAT|nr:unnamed protein product [Protopolystoma xenopodis]